jgi:hypothetical protein
LTAIANQALAYLAPGSVRPVEPDSIETLDLDATRAPGAFDPEQLAWDLR